MPIQKSISGICLFMLCILGSCSTEPKKEDITDKLIGYWEVIEATRNNRRTSTLEDAYFEFAGNEKIKLNLDGSDQTGDYKVKDNIVKVSNTSTDGDFVITSVGTDSMSMTTEKEFGDIVFKFEFQLLRADTTLFE